MVILYVSYVYETGHRFLNCWVDMMYSLNWSPHSATICNVTVREKEPVSEKWVFQLFNFSRWHHVYELQHWSFYINIRSIESHKHERPREQKIWSKCRNIRTFRAYGFKATRPRLKKKVRITEALECWGFEILSYYGIWISN